MRSHMCTRSCYPSGYGSQPARCLATREARAQLPALLERFRQAGADAEPVVIGARRRPEAVVLSYERYLKLVGGRERVAAALEQQAREAGKRSTPTPPWSSRTASCTRCAENGAPPSADSGACAPCWTPTCSYRPRSRRPVSHDRSSPPGSRQRFELIASPALLDELADVLARPKFRRYITVAVATEFIDGLATDATIVADPPELPGVSPDPDDDYLGRARARRWRGLPRLRRPAPPRPD